MPIRTFIHNISEEDIKDALGTPPRDFERDPSVNEEIKREYAGSGIKVLGISAILLAIGIVGAISSANVGSAFYFIAFILLAVFSLVFLVIGYTSSQNRPKQDSPISAMVAFYEEVLNIGYIGNYGKAYQLLAPIAINRPPATSVAELRELWSGVVKSIEVKIKESMQEEVISVNHRFNR